MGLKPSATSFRPASSASVCVSSASRADGWIASAMAFMVVAIVVILPAVGARRVQVVRIGVLVAARRRRCARDALRAARAPAVRRARWGGDRRDF